MQAGLPLGEIGFTLRARWASCPRDVSGIAHAVGGGFRSGWVIREDALGGHEVGLPEEGKAVCSRQLTNRPATTRSGPRELLKWYCALAGRDILSGAEDRLFARLLRITSEGQLEEVVLRQAFAPTRPANGCALIRRGVSPTSAQRA